MSILRACFLSGLLYMGLFTVDNIAFAQDISNVDLRQEDTDGDGNPDITTIDVQNDSFDGSVQVIDGAEDMEWHADWRVATDFTNDVWLYDVGRDGTAQLVVDYQMNDSQATALLYYDLDGDGKVSFTINDSEVAVTEIPLAPVTVSADGGWLLPDGDLNWNLRVRVDGPRPAFVFTYNLSNPWMPFLVADGDPDIELRFVDSDSDNVPDYGIWRLLAPTPRDWTGVTGRTFVWANKDERKPLMVHEPFFWPLLAQKPVGRDVLAERAINGYFDAPPFFVIDWENALMETFGFPGYPIEHGFHINSQAASSLDQLNYANFEIMQAYYDLGADQDGYPELHIRHRYFGPFDPHGWNLSSPINDIRYSWTVTDLNALNWDYKIGLAGRHEILKSITLPELSLQTIPFENLPAWSMTGDWDYATFVASENGSYESSEGIYDWGAVDTPLGDDPRGLSLYLSGRLDAQIGEAFDDITTGLRGEFSIVPLGELGLYFSPIDNRLHMKWAEQGIWRLDEEQIVRTNNLDNDEAIDVWARESMAMTLAEDAPAQASGDTNRALQPAEAPATVGEAVARSDIIEALYALDGYLLYGNASKVALVASEYDAMLFETLPPTDHETWQTHRAQLATYEDRRRDPTDLHSWLNAFSGRRTAITGASLTDVRITDNGFRFELLLEPGYRIAGPDLLGLNDLAPGEYLVSNQGDAFRISSLTPPEPIVAMQIDDAEPIVAGDTIPIRLVLANEGLADAGGLTVLVTASNGDDRVELLRRQIDLLAGQPQRLNIAWQPLVPGSWTLQAELLDTDGRPLPIGQNSLSLSVTAPAAPWAIFGRDRAVGGLIIAMLATLALLAALLVWLARVSAMEPLPDRFLERKTDA